MNAVPFMGREGLGRELAQLADLLQSLGEVFDIRSIQGLALEEVSAREKGM